MKSNFIGVTKSCLPSLEEYVEYLEKIWVTHLLTNDAEFTQLLAKKLEYFLKIKNLVLMNNGTSPLHLALRVLKLKGEVITTPFTFATTTNVLVWEGLKPVFADIDSSTYNIDPADVEKKISKKTSAILAVHVYGNPCNAEALQEIADKYNLKIIYDAAHAFAVEYNNEPITNYGDISTLSFHATKIFNTIEGGAMIANNSELVDNLRLMRNHGIASEEKVLLPGTNVKMNEFQAIMGLCNLKHINEVITRRKKRYNRYKQRLSKINGVYFQKNTASKYNYSYMPIRFESTNIRDLIYTELLKKNVKARKYFYPLTANFEYFKGLNLVKKYHLLNADFVADRILCLPLYPDLDLSDIDKICSHISDCLKRQKPGD